MAYVLTTTPQNLRQLLGGTGVGFAFEGVAENLSRETIFERSSPTVPAATESAFRHPPGEKWTVWIHGGGGDSVWLWATGRAEVHIEPGTRST